MKKKIFTAILFCLAYSLFSDKLNIDPISELSAEQIAQGIERLESIKDRVITPAESKTDMKLLMVFYIAPSFSVDGLFRIYEKDD